MDIVFTWVDGGDPDFIKAKEAYAPKNSTRSFDASAERFADHHELKYSLRSLEKFAPWVSRVLLVTNGQIPHWLDCTNDKLVLVSHEDIFENKDLLPTFSTRAIEPNLVRIPNLSEQFIYFNDDFFLGAPVTPEDFFNSEGEELIYLTPFSAPPPVGNHHVVVNETEIIDISGEICPWVMMMQYTNMLFNSRYGSRDRLSVEHIPYPLRRSTCLKLLREWETEFKDSIRQRFRIGEQIGFIFSYYHFIIEKMLRDIDSKEDSRVVMVPDEDTSLFMSIKLENSKEQLMESFETLAKLSPKFWCVQSVEAVIPDVRNYFINTMEGIFPGKSRFEK